MHSALAGVVDTIVTELRAHAYSFADERQFHDGIAQVLTTIGIPFDREVVAGPRDRFDFRCRGAVVIEAKIKGSFPAALRQVDRYCARGDVSAVVLITTRLWNMAGCINTFSLHGVPVHVVRVRGQGL